MTQLLKEYKEATEQLFSELVTVDVSIDGINRPQELKSPDWIEMRNSKGIYIKSISLKKPDTFAIGLIYAQKGATEFHHKMKDIVEIHCISGKFLMNGLQFGAGDRLVIPGGIEYSFEFLDNTYLTVKFTPQNPLNFK